MVDVSVLIEALQALRPQAPPTLHTPSFDWSSRDQYDDFQLFVKSVNSWFLLQGIPTTVKEGEREIENPIRLDYILNFLGNQGRQRYDRWKPTGVDAEGQKKKASAFLEHLQSTMDHEISIRCRIYKLEETRIQPGESPDELVDRLRMLADHCNFPSEDEKERNVQYRLVRALDDRDLVKKLITLPIKEMTAKMLEVCRTHIAINSEMEAMGLGNSKDCSCNPEGTPTEGTHQGTAQTTTTTPTGTATNTHADTVLYSTPLDKPLALPKMQSAVHVGKLDTGSENVGRPRDDRQPLDNANLSRTVDPDPSRTRSMMLEPMLTPTVMRYELQQS